MLQILDELDYGLMVVTEAARLRFANRVARRECALSRCMRLGDDHHVTPRLDSEKPRFQRALADARLGRRSMLVLRCDDGPVSLAVVPIADPLDDAQAPASLLVFGRRQVCEPLSVEFFAREHRLTAAERAVLRDLCDGLRPGQSARRSGVAVSTVRTQIKSIRNKTGTDNIGELVRMITVLPPIVAVLN